VAEAVDIKLGKPNVLGVNADDSGLLDVDVELKPRPPDEWLQMFVQL
jgi:hypothetical protein